MFFELKYESDEVDRLLSLFPEAVTEATVAKVTEAVKFLERVIKSDHDFPYGAGPLHLLQTIGTEVDISGRAIIGIVGTPAKYAEPVEYGTKPHFPPIEPIQFWVEKKLGIEGKEAKGVAFLIARKISVEGTEGAHMFEKTYNEYKPDVEKILDEIAEDALRRVE
jgi:hypothetical protein